MNETVKDVGIVALGGIVNELIEYGATKIAKNSIDVGGVGLNIADAAGVLAGLTEVTYGMAKDKKSVILFGAGGLALAAATIVGKYLIVYNPLASSAKVSAVQTANVSTRIVTVGDEPTGLGKMTGSMPANNNVINPHASNLMI